MCKNLNGFCFGGDTAQTIASGVGFRFQDVSRLFHDYFMAGAVSKNIQVPKIWSLSQNYRTHSGILRLSGSLLSLVFELFPNSIDRVKKELGALYDGETPLFITKTNQDLASQLFGESTSTG